MATKLSKWGNSLGVRLPKYVVERTGLAPGDYLFIRLTDAGDIVIRSVKARDIHAGYVPDDSPSKPKIPTEVVLAKW